MLTGFGIGFFYRVLLPGVLAVILLAPVRPIGALVWLGVSDLADKTAIFFLIVFAAGLVLSSARHVIYYAAEGFYWVPWAHRFFRRTLQKRVASVHQELTALTRKRTSAKLSARERLREMHLYEFLSDFPVSTKDGRVQYRVEGPTRIGNVIASYELYADDRYGIDGVFYWFHLRFAAEAPVQAELDRAEAIADGMVFCTVASAAIALTYAAIGLARVIGLPLEMAGLRLVAVPAPYGVLALCFVASCVAWAGFNRLAIFALRTLGKQMRATIDLGVPSLVQLAQPWKPNASQVTALRVRKAYLEYGESPADSREPPQ